MSPRMNNFELKVGIFVFIGLIFLTIFVFKIGDIEFLKPGYNIRIVFNYVSGLDIGASVNLAGVEIGEVKSMEIFYNEKLKRTQVDVTAWINSKATIRENSIAKITTPGVLGEKYIELTPGSINNPPLKEGDTLFGQDPVSLEDLTESINRVAKELNNLLSNPNLRESINNLRGATEKANSILAKIDEGEGTVGKLISEDAVYKNLEDFTEDIKKNPWKLLHKTKEKEETSAGGEEKIERKKQLKKKSIFF